MMAGQLAGCQAGNAACKMGDNIYGWPASKQASYLGDLPATLPERQPARRKANKPVSKTFGQPAFRPERKLPGCRDGQHDRRLSSKLADRLTNKKASRLARKSANWPDGWKADCTVQFPPKLRLGKTSVSKMVCPGSAFSRPTYSAGGMFWGAFERRGRMPRRHS